jgi:hypothetical protein
MSNSQFATEDLEARLAEELEERTEFCDWVSICCTCCGCTKTPTTAPSCTNAATCSVTGS